MILYTACHDHDEWVELRRDEFEYAWRHGAKLRAQSVAARDRDRPSLDVASDEQKLRIQQLGAVAELVVRKALGRPMRLPEKTYQAADIPPQTEVRLIGDERFGLRVYGKDLDSRFVVGVVIPRGQEKGPYRIPGWCSASRAKANPGWKMDPNNKGWPFWAVPQDELESLSTLPEEAYLP